MILETKAEIRGLENNEWETVYPYKGTITVNQYPYSGTYTTPNYGTISNGTTSNGKWSSYQD